MQLHHFEFSEFCGMRNELNDIRAQLRQVEWLLADRRCELKYLVFAYELAALRFKAELNAYNNVLRKANFNPNQPRIPAGGRNGGRWTSAFDAGGEEITDFSAQGRIGGTSVDYSNALTGISTIDDATKKLSWTLAGIVDVVPKGSGPLYGIAVHTAFAVAVRLQGLPGIGIADVESTFSLVDGARYGSRDSIRTDVVLRNDVGDIIAIYDVKTGRKGLDAARAAELRIKTRVGQNVPIIELSLRRGVVLKSAFHKWFCSGFHTIYVDMR